MRFTVPLMSILFGLCLFIFATLLIPTETIVSAHDSAMRSEQVISQTRGAYAKVLDGFYFNLASLLIPMGALLAELAFRRIDTRVRVFGTIALLLFLLSYALR